MGRYISVYRVNISKMKEIRGAKNHKVWKSLAPFHTGLSREERDALEDIVFEDFLPPGRAPRYLSVFRKYCTHFGASLKVGSWSIINFTKSYTIMERIDALFAPLAPGLSMDDSLYNPKDTLWDLPPVTGVDTHYLSNEEVAGAVKKLKPALTKANQTLQKLAALSERAEELKASSVAALLRYVAFSHRCGHPHDLKKTLEEYQLPTEEAAREALDKKAAAFIEETWGEKASHEKYGTPPPLEYAAQLFDGANDLWGWLREAAAARMGIVYIVQ